VAGAKKDFEDMIKETADADPWMKDHPPVVEWIGPSWSGGGVEAEHPLVQTIRKAFVDRKNEEPEIVGAPWPADAIFLTEYDIPAVNFGPGDNSSAHQANETVSIDRLVDCAAIVACSIADWCGFEDDSNGK
jgi:acetylornithine deacetylase